MEKNYLLNAIIGDTAGSIAGVIWEKPDYLVKWVRKLMPKDMLKVVDDFDRFIDEDSSI